jgi:hypothetical protein
VADLSTNPALIRIEAIEAELSILRKKLEGRGSANPDVMLEGIWSDVKFSDEEIDEVRRAWKTKFDDVT